MKRLLLFLIGILVFVLWIYYIDPHEVWEIIKTTHLAYLGVGFVFFFVSYLFKMVRWQLVLRPIQVVPFIQISKYYWSCEFINNFMPLRLGELSKGAFLKKDYGLEFAQSLSTIAADRIYGIFVRLLVLCSIPLLAIDLYPFLKGYLIYATSLITCVLLLFILLLLKDIKTLKLLRKFLFFLPHLWVDKISHFIETSIAAVRQVHTRKRDILLFLGISILALVAQSLRTYFFFRAVGLEVPLLIFLVTTTLSDFLVILPSPPASLGTTEWYANIIYTFGLGISKNGVAGIALLTHAIILLILALLGVWSLTSLGYSILGDSRAKLKSNRAQMEQRPIT